MKAQGEVAVDADEEVLEAAAAVAYRETCEEVVRNRDRHQKSLHTAAVALAVWMEASEASMVEVVDSEGAVEEVAVAVGVDGYAAVEEQPLVLGELHEEVMRCIDKDHNLHPHPGLPRRE